MKRVRLISTSFEDGLSEIDIHMPLVYKDYVIDLALYNNSNTKSRVASLHPRTKCRIYKMMEWLEYPDYDYYIWANSKLYLLDGFFENMFAYENDKDAELFVFNHPDRSSIKAEMDVIIDCLASGNEYITSRYGGDIIEEQVNKYILDENFVDDKLFDGGLFMYTKKLVENRDHNMMLDWFLHNILYSLEDQLWLPYLIKKYNVNYRVYDHGIYTNRFLSRKYH